jgi:hypothetical protein
MKKLSDLLRSFLAGSLLIAKTMSWFVFASRVFLRRGNPVKILPKFRKN